MSLMTSRSSRVSPSGMCTCSRGERQASTMRYAALVCCQGSAGMPAGGAAMQAPAFAAPWPLIVTSQQLSHAHTLCTAPPQAPPVAWWAAAQAWASQEQAPGRAPQVPLPALRPQHPPLAPPPCPQL